VQVTDNGLELVFPDGRVAGHRSYKLYYKQNPKVDDTREAHLISKIMSQYRAIGWDNSWHSNQSELSRKILKMKARNQGKIGASRPMFRGHTAF
jgi:hypothetical protein